MDILREKIDEGMNRLLGVDPDRLEYLQGYVAALRDTYDEIVKGELS